MMLNLFSVKLLLSLITHSVAILESFTEGSNIQTATTKLLSFDLSRLDMHTYIGSRCVRLLTSYGWVLQQTIQ